MLNKQTKIVATIGPATESEEMLLKLKKAGLNVCRLNFSHGDHKEHQRKVRNIRKVIKKTGGPLAILQDLSGPKIRTGDFGTNDGTVTLKKGQKFTFTTEKILGTNSEVFINYPSLPKEIRKDDFILVDDGKLKLKVVKITKNEVICRVELGGTIKGRRGVNLPGVDLSVSCLTKKDKKDLEFAVKNKIDYIALSFVRRASDIAELRKILKKKNINSDIIAKIETQQAVDNIEDIIEEADGIMVARGDLAIEIPAEEVPLFQKEIIGKCNDIGKPVITATQMLESMINSPVATRAEVSDVANAIMDGTDAVMLSEETTLGNYPLQTVQLMSRIAKEIEYKSKRQKAKKGNEKLKITRIADSVTSSIVDTAQDLNATLIFVLTETGFTARMISRFKPDALIISATPNDETFNKLALISGCYPVKTSRKKSLKAVMEWVRKYCASNKITKKGDKVVIAAGVPFNKEAFDTNMMLVMEV